MNPLRLKRRQNLVVVVVCSRHTWIGKFGGGAAWKGAEQHTRTSGDVHFVAHRLCTDAMVSGNGALVDDRGLM